MWKSFYHSEIGWAHVKRELPCQDFCFASSSPIPYLIVCDGAGSATLSHIGSKRTVETLSNLIELFQSIIQEVLNEELREDLQKTRGKQLKEIFVKSSLKEIEKLSFQYKVPKNYFRSTLMLLIVGKKRSFWLKIGDGAILIQNSEGELELVGPIQKGEFANETFFLSENLKDEEIAFGLLNKELTAVMSFTDGAGGKLISHDGKNFAPLIKKWFEQIREDKFQKEDLVKFLSAEEVRKKTSGDNRSIAMLVCESRLQNKESERKNSTSQMDKSPTQESLPKKLEQETKSTPTLQEKN